MVGLLCVLFFRELSYEDTQKVAKCPLFQCSEFKGGSRRPSQPKAISFRPYSRLTPGDLNQPVCLKTPPFLFFGDHNFRRAKTGPFFFYSFWRLPFSKSKIGAKTSGLRRKKSPHSVRLSGTFREFGRSGFVFRNCPIFGQWNYGTPS